MKKVLFYAICLFWLCIPLGTKAQQFEVDGITYNILSDTKHSVEVAPQYCSRYHGRINIPASVVYNDSTYDVVALGYEAFYGCNLTGITIPSSVTQLKGRCFFLANLPSSFVIPASITSIEEQALTILNLSSFTIDENNPVYTTINGILFSKDTSTLVACPVMKSGLITLPLNTRHITPFAFCGCKNMTSIMLPEGLSTIGGWAFMACINLINIHIPSSVTHIGTQPFAYCYVLNSLSIAQDNSHYYMDGMMIYNMTGDSLISAHKSSDTLFLPNTLRYVSGFAGNEDVKYVKIPEGVLTLGDQTFNSSSLKRIDLPGYLHFIDEWAFYYCESLQHVTMPATLDTMGKGCFEGCSKLTSINIPNGLRVIPPEAFFYCTKLKNISWGNTVEIIDTVAFGGCAFTKIEFPATLRHIKISGFSHYSSANNAYLRQIVFTAPIDTIEAGTFEEQKIKSIRFRNNIPPVTATIPEQDVNYGCLSNATVDSIIVPCGSLNNWLSDSYWGQYADKYYEECVGIETAEEQEIVLYPNPATDHLSLIGLQDCQTLAMVNLLGQTVLTQAISSNTLNLDVSNLERGVYLLKLESPNGLLVKKVILH